MKIISAFLFLSLTLSASAQDSPPAAPSLHITVNLVRKSVVSAEFGSLPKDIAPAEVTACNETAAPLNLTQSRLTQILRSKGLEALSRDAALAVINSGQQQSRMFYTAKYAQLALNIVTGLVVSKAVTLGQTLGSALPSVQGVMQVVVPQLQSTIADHAFISFDRAALPTVMQLAPSDCALGTLLISAPPKNAASDFVFDLGHAGK